MTESERKLRVGIAGYGVVGKRRRHFIDLHSQLETAAVCDKTFTETGRDDDGVMRHQDYRHLLDEPLDALFVCLTNDLAPMVTMAGLEKGCHVFCEKPPGRSVEDLEKVIAVKNSRPDLRLKYGFNHRYHESVKDALRILHSGELGELLNIRGVYGKSKFISFGQNSDWRVRREIAGGGILLDQGIHMVDLIRLFSESEFREIYSIISNDYWKHDVEDNAYALMKAESGVVAMLHSTATQWRHKFELELTCARGSLILSGILSGSKSYGAEKLTVVWADDDDQGDPRERTQSYNKDDSWKDEIVEFADAILRDQPISNGSSADALETMKLVTSIYLADNAWAEKWNLS